MITASASWHSPGFLHRYYQKHKDVARERAEKMREEVKTVVSDRPVVSSARALTIHDSNRIMNALSSLFFD
jgi:hypothetical protein